MDFGTTGVPVRENMPAMMAPATANTSIMTPMTTNGDFRDPVAELPFVDLGFLAALATEAIVFLPEFFALEISETGVLLTGLAAPAERPVTFGFGAGATFLAMVNPFVAVLAAYDKVNRGINQDQFGKCS